MQWWSQEIEFPGRLWPQVTFGPNLFRGPSRCPRVPGVFTSAPERPMQTCFCAFYRVGHQGLWSSAKPALVIEQLRERQGEAATEDPEPTSKESGRGGKERTVTMGVKQHRPGLHPSAASHYLAFSESSSPHYITWVWRPLCHELLEGRGCAYPVVHLPQAPGRVPMQVSAG